MKVKIFDGLYSSLTDNNVAEELETQINKWLAAGGISIMHILQTETDTTLTITIFYAFDEVAR